MADKGNKLVSADYSQFELRLAAVLAEDKELVDMFNRGADIHTMTAAQVYERSPEDVTKQMRRAAKVINFGILYGMSPHGLVIAASMNFDQAKTFINPLQRPAQATVRLHGQCFRKSSQRQLCRNTFWPPPSDARYSFEQLYGSFRR